MSVKARCRFHVDNLSSAHVYLRLPDGGTLDDIPTNVLEECCQIVKHNSIQGCKSSAVDIVYTLWGNLKKTASMEVRLLACLTQCGRNIERERQCQKTKCPLYMEPATLSGSTANNVSSLTHP